MLPLLALLAAPALAEGTHIVAVGPQVELQVAGTWGRVIPVEGGWRYAFSRNGDYWVAPLEREGDGWDLDISRELQLTDHGELKDHAIKRCPDGTFLHAASANLDQPNDSAYIFRYDGDWNQVQSGVIEEREPDRAHNDMPLLCQPVFTGTFFNGAPGESGFFAIEDDLSITRGPELPMGVSSTGAGVMANADGETFTVVTVGPDGDLVRSIFDADFNLLDQRETPILESASEQSYWPQGLMRVGDYTIVAVMVRDRSWPGDDGDIVLVVLDDDWDDLIERINITQNPPDNLGMRPWIARSGSTLLVSYDRQREHTVIEVQLDLDAFGLQPGDDDTGWGDGEWSGGDGADGADGGGDAGAAGDTGAQAQADGCGCAQGRAAGGLAALALGMVALGARRRR